MPWWWDIVSRRSGGGHSTRAEGDTSQTLCPPLVLVSSAVASPVSFSCPSGVRPAVLWPQEGKRESKPKRKPKRKRQRSGAPRTTWSFMPSGPKGLSQGPQAQECGIRQTVQRVCRRWLDEPCVLLSFSCCPRATLANSVSSSCPCDVRPALL